MIRQVVALIFLSGFSSHLHTFTEPSAMCPPPRQSIEGAEDAKLELTD